MLRQDVSLAVRWRALLRICSSPCMLLLPWMASPGMMCTGSSPASLASSARLASLTHKCLLVFAA